jgi:hypothetical protein
MMEREGSSSHGFSIAQRKRGGSSVEGRYVWVDIQPNILAPGYQEKIERAFERGIVFGHRILWHGSARFDLAFRGFNQFAEYLSQSRPGDKYEVWSLPDLIAKNLVLAHGEC